MKDFIKYTLATVCGIFLTGIVFFLLTLFTLVGVLASGSSTPPIEKGSALRLTLNGELIEDVKDDPLGDLLGDNYRKIGLRTILDAIDAAKNDPNVTGIYIEAGTLSASAPAMTRDIRQALADFKKSGKFIIAYGDSYTQSTYYICSVADRILLNPKGQIDWHGLASQPIFYKDLLEKIGVRMQVFKVGTYKSAVEPFTQTEMSEANRAQITSYLGDIWQTMLTDVATSRHLRSDRLNALADSLTFFMPAENMVESGLADTLCYMDGVAEILRQKMGCTKDVLPLVSIKEMAAGITPDTSGEKIAVYYAFGDIVDSRMDWSENVIDATTMTRDLKRLREDKSVKAVVIRINSGGGSAFASEQIWHEVKLLNQAKPVVVSMGGMAASGAYYLSCGAGYIMAEPTTLTGSIGIFGLIPDCSELLTKKLGLHFDAVTTNEHADFGTPSRPFNATESRMMQGYIERGYHLFTTRVAEGRKMSPEQVEALAEGRVWTGKQALENGLVDANGNLQDAIGKAASMAGLDTYYTVAHPTPKPWYENLLNERRDDYLNATLQERLGSYYAPLVNLKRLEQMDAIQARLPYEPNITH